MSLLISDMVSHSVSIIELKFIFQYLLADYNLSKLRLLDIGSRFGAVLYGAYFYTDIPEIIGVEINNNLCVAQQQIVEKYQMQNRIKVSAFELL